MEGTLLITNGKIITWQNPNQILEGHALRIANGIIVEIAPQNELLERASEEERLDARGQYILPGSICAHTHFYSAFSRGMSIPGAAPEAFPQVLEKLWWRLDRALTLENVRASTLVGLVDAIRHGTTTLIDHHASPAAIDGSLDVIAEALGEAGLRGVLCYEVTDRNGEEGARAGIAENVRFIERVRRDPQAAGWLGAMFGLHASLTLSDETLDASRAAAGEGVGFHVHAAEHPVDEYDSLARSGARVVDRLQRFGLLGPRSIAVHAVHVDAREIGLLAETNTWVTHQPRSNMNNGVGLPAVESMLRAGVRVCLGNDGFSNAMWEDWKAAYLAHKLINADPRRMPASTIVEMAVYNNAALAHLQLGGAPLGVIEAGAAADLMLVDFQPFTPLTTGNLPWQILFGFRDSMVTTTIVGGDVLMRDRELVTLDAEKIMRDALQQAPHVWERYQNLF